MINVIFSIIYIPIWNNELSSQTLFHLSLICLNVLFVHESPQRANYLINVAGSIINYIMQKANTYVLH